MHEVTELVEQRDDVGVFHEIGRQVADEGALGELLPGDARRDGKHRPVLELALAGMQVELDAPDAAAAHRDVVDPNVLVPGRRARDRRVLEPEEPTRDVEQALDDARRLEVLAKLLRVDVERLATDQLAVVARVGRVNGRDVGGRDVGGRGNGTILAHPLEESPKVTPRRRVGRLGHPAR